jgi:diaminopimelate decarboxylase
VVPVPEWPRPYERPEVRDVEVDAVGELCTPRDVLTRGQPVDRLRVGDLLVFGRTGAYGWDISHHEFLRHDPPQFLVTGGAGRVGAGS